MQVSPDLWYPEIMNKATALFAALALPIVVSTVAQAQQPVHMVFAYQVNDGAYVPYWDDTYVTLTTSDIGYTCGASKPLPDNGGASSGIACAANATPGVVIAGEGVYCDAAHPIGYGKLTLPSGTIVNVFCRMH